MDIVLELIRNTAHGYWCCFKSINPPKFPTFQNLLTQPITWWWLGIFLYDQRNVTVTNLFHRKFYPKDPLFLFLISSVWKKKWCTFINDSHVEVYLKTKWGFQIEYTYKAVVLRLVVRLMFYKKDRVIDMTRKVSRATS